MLQTCNSHQMKAEKQSYNFWYILVWNFEKFRRTEKAGENSFPIRPDTSLGSESSFPPKWLVLNELTIQSRSTAHHTQECSVLHTWVQEWLYSTVLYSTVLLDIMAVWWWYFCNHFNVVNVLTLLLPPQQSSDEKLDAVLLLVRSAHVQVWPKV